MSELAVGSLKGLAANDFVIDVAAGSRVVQPGAILQVVSTVKTDVFTSNSPSFTPITGLSATITPTSASNKILIVCQITHGVGSDDGQGHFKLSGGNTSVYVGDAGQSLQPRAVFGGFSNANLLRVALSSGIVFLDSPATTSEVTYGVDVRTATSSLFVNRARLDENSVNVSRGASSITVMEVAG